LAAPPADSPVANSLAYLIEINWRRRPVFAVRQIFGLFDGEISPSPPAKSRRRRQTRREIWRLDGEIWPSMRELASSRELAFIRFAHTTADPRCTPRLPAFLSARHAGGAGR